MAEPEQPGDSTSPHDPALQQRFEALQTLLETLTEDVMQDVSAIQVAADSLLYGFRREQTFSHERLYASLELITAACRQAAESIENARREFLSS